MIIPTLCNNSFLYTVHRHKDRFMLELEKRKAFRLTIAIFTCVVVIVLAWILRP